MDLCGSVDNMSSPCAVVLLTQTNVMVPRGPQHRASGWLLLPWPSLVVATGMDDHSTASWSAVTESTVDDTVGVDCRAPHWLLNASRLRTDRAPQLRGSAMTLWSRAAGSRSMVIEVCDRSSPCRPRCSKRAGWHRSGVSVRAVGLRGPTPARHARLHDRPGQCQQLSRGW